jgi:hypothetical protein
LRVGDTICREIEGAAIASMPSMACWIGTAGLAYRFSAYRVMAVDNLPVPSPVAIDTL